MDDEEYRIPRDYRGLWTLLALCGLLAFIAGAAYLSVNWTTSDERPATAPSSPDATVPVVVGTEEIETFRVVNTLPTEAVGDAATIAGQTVVIRHLSAEGNPAMGTGFVYRDGVIVSAAHIVAEGLGTEVDVYCGDVVSRAAVVGHDAVRDVMVLEAEGCTGTSLDLDTRALRADTGVHVAGFSFAPTLDSAHRYYRHALPLPDAELDAATMRDERTRVILEEMRRLRIPRLVAIDALLIPGNSGSPVYRGTSIVGMVVILDTPGRRSFIVPAANIRHLLRELDIR